MTSGTILHLQRLSTEDGPGIRTTVFFKGCPMHCAWCHNPESISAKMQTHWYPMRCIRCETCVTACPNGCLRMSESGLVIDRVHCQACGTCTDACPSGALEALGRKVTPEEVLAEVLKDRTYYEKSDGGVTLSGGEPTFQPDFAEELLIGLKEAGLHTALDTCGLCSRQTLERLLPFTDLVLFDLKLMDDDSHRALTGAPNQPILDNLRYLKDQKRSATHPFELWIRTPLIPGASCSEENLRAIGQYLAERLDGYISRWDLCAFNNLCRDQYVRLGQEWAYARTPLMTAEELARCAQAARSSGVQPELVHATGATRATEA